ncbi:MAG: peptidoglycan-binding domain-containing protein [Planctomycetota bacterium]|jgi:hypothetical protein
MPTYTVNVKRRLAITIRNPVGKGQKRSTRDEILAIQGLLLECKQLLAPLRPVKPTGTADEQTIAAIEEFQRRVVRLRRPDGWVGPTGKTLKALNEKTGRGKGTLTFSSGGVSVNTTCWWDPDNVINKGTYKKCSKTRMATKKDSVTKEKRPGIYLPDAISKVTGQRSIFIHEGSNPKWSDGCIVIKRSDLMKMWNAISPADGENVTVVLSNV